MLTDMKCNEIGRSRYIKLQSIRPQSVDLALADTPVSFATSISALVGRERQRR